MRAINLDLEGGAKKRSRALASFYYVRRVVKTANGFALSSHRYGYGVNVILFPALREFASKRHECSRNAVVELSIIVTFARFTSLPLGGCERGNSRLIRTLSREGRREHCTVHTLWTRL